MHSRFIPLVFSLAFLFLSCRSINTNIIRMNIPASTVYFSFDDGPNAHGGATERLLDVLKKYQIKAIFFLLGENAEQYPDLARRIYEEGHYVANHGYSSKHAYGMSDDEFRNNLLRGEAAIANALGHDGLSYRLYRPHGGFYSSRQEKICADEGYAIVAVTVRVYDAVVGAAKRKKIVNNTVNLTIKRGGGLILLHDGRDSYSRIKTETEKNINSSFNRSWISDAVEEIITSLLDEGFNLYGPDFLTGSDLEK